MKKIYQVYLSVWRIGVYDVFLKKGDLIEVENQRDGLLYIYCNSIGKPMWVNGIDFDVHCKRIL